jgi:hypothetical protein
MTLRLMANQSQMAQWSMLKHEKTFEVRYQTNTSRDGHKEHRFFVVELGLVNADSGWKATIEEALEDLTSQIAEGVTVNDNG